MTPKADNNIGGSGNPLAKTDSPMETTVRTQATMISRVESLNSARLSGFKTETPLESFGPISGA